MNVRELMLLTQVALQPQDSLRTAVELFKMNKLHAIPVIDEVGKLIGLFTNSNLYSCLLDNIDIDTPIEQFYIREAAYFFEDESFNHIKELCHLITTARVGQLPVVNRAYEPIGMVTQVGMISEFLRQSECVYSELFSVIDNVPAGIVATDDKGFVTITNLYAQQILQDIHYGTHIGVFLDELNADFRLIANGSWSNPQKIEFRSQKIFATAVPVFQNGQIKGTIFVLQDLTNVEQIAHELIIVKELKKTLETVLEVAYEGVAVINEQGNITFANANFCNEIGKTREQVIGENITEFLNLTGQTLPFDVLEIDSKPSVVSCLPYTTEGKKQGRVIKIYQDLDQLSDLMQQVSRLKVQLDYYKDELNKLNGTRYTISSIVSQNERVAKLKDQSLQVAQNNTTILITGESGTGKELFAHSIHNASNRRKEPFIKINCSAIPPELAESELFGYEDGAFTGARKEGKLGKFELANGGTIFLDEIGDMPYLLQSKLLRVIQEKEFEKVGGTKTRKVDVRVITATNRNLKQLVADGKFREDLYFRLNVIELRLPPLRERIEDIPVLAQAFIQKYNNLLSKRVTGITDSALKALAQYSWPGNVREFENTIERILNYKGNGDINLQDLPEEITQPGPVEQEANLLGNSPVSLNTIEMKAIEAALIQSNGNKSKAAKMLGISRSKLYEKLAANTTGTNP